MLSRVKNNIGLKAFSLVLAIGGWAFLRFGSSPLSATPLSQQLSVPIATAGLSGDLVARYGERQAVVTIVTPRESGNPIRPDNVHAVLSLDGKGPGVYNVPVQVIAPRLEIQSYSPATVTLTIDRIEERSISISTSLTGDRKTRIVASAVRLDPRTAMIRGATDDLARVSGVRVELPLPNAAASVDEMLRVSPVDASGKDVAGVTVSPNLVRVRVQFTDPEKAP